jgi:integrase/recombinase XerD
VRDYQTHLHEETNDQGEPFTVGTQNNNLKVAKLFFRFLKEEDYLTQDPGRDVPYAKTPKRLPRSILTRKEVSKLLRTPDTHSLMGYRDRAMLEVFYSTGLRNSELSALKVEDVDTVEGFVRVNLGKGGKDRVVPMGRIACRYVENYVKAVRPHLARDLANRWLFLSLRGNQMSRHVIAQTVRRCAKKAKLGKTVTAHTLRHTCATQMMRNKANLRHIQELLGHACLTTTQIYTSVTIADLKEAHQKYHPRERERGTA